MARTTKTVTALAPWFGAARIIAERVATHLDGCDWVGVPFAGGMTELLYIKARTMMVSDLHRHVINLGRVVQDDKARRDLVKLLNDTPFHPDTLRIAQGVCGLLTPVYPFSPEHDTPRVAQAAAYFICSWMGRSGKAGTDDEFKGGPAYRWDSGGGDSAVRFRSAIRALGEWGRVFRRATFHTFDVFEFLTKVKDAPGIGVYCDPPFPEVGDSYTHKFTEADHRRLAEKLTAFQHARIVCRFYDHPLIRELYPESAGWVWHHLNGRDQKNNATKPEVILVRNGGQA
jgi:DNA adenine methylase